MQAVLKVNTALCIENSNINNVFYRVEELIEKKNDKLLLKVIKIQLKDVIITTKTEVSPPVALAHGD